MVEHLTLFLDHMVGHLTNLFLKSQIYIQFNSIQKILQLVFKEGQQEDWGCLMHTS